MACVRRKKSGSSEVVPMACGGWLADHRVSKAGDEAVATVNEILRQGRYPQEPNCSVISRMAGIVAVTDDCNGSMANALAPRKGSLLAGARYRLRRVGAFGGQPDFFLAMQGRRDEWAGIIGTRRANSFPKA